MDEDNKNERQGTPAGQLVWPLIPIDIDLDEEQYEKLEMRAESEGLSMEDMLLKLIEDEWKEKGG